MSLCCLDKSSPRCSFPLFIVVINQFCELIIIDRNNYKDNHVSKSNAVIYGATTYSFEFRANNIKITECKHNRNNNNSERHKNVE